MFQDGYDLSRPNNKQQFDFGDELLLTITALLLPTSEFNEAREAPEKTPESVQLPICNALKALIAKRNETYRTTIAEDSMLLQSESLPVRQRMAIEVRLGEKEILAMAASEVDKRITKFMAIQENAQAKDSKKRKI